MLHLYTALLTEADGDLPATVTAATHAAELLLGAQGFRAWALAIHARALIRQGHVDQALALAREAAAIHAAPGAMPAEAFLPDLALAEALTALGDRAGARARVDDACDRLARRAATIADPTMRSSYLAMPTHVHLRALQQETP
jgi:hypothetical protein